MQSVRKNMLMALRQWTQPQPSRGDQKLCTENIKHYGSNTKTNEKYSETVGVNYVCDPFEVDPLKP